MTLFTTGRYANLNTMRKMTEQDWQKRVEEAVGQIVNSLHEDLNLEALSQNLNSSPFHFHRMFKLLTGESVHDCIKRLRLEKSANLLNQSQISVIDAALEAGFQTPESFSRAFKKAFGISPSRQKRLKFWNGKIYSRAGIHFDSGPGRQWFLLFDQEDTEMNIKITHLKPFRLLGYSGIGDYWQMPEAWGRLQNTLCKSGLNQKRISSIGLFMDSTNARVDWDSKRWAATFMDSGRFPIPPVPDLEEFQTPGGLYAVFVHYGSGEEIGHAWDKWHQEWLPDSGWKLDPERPSLEWYQSHFEDTPTELQVTLLCDPVIK